MNGQFMERARSFLREPVFANVEGMTPEDAERRRMWAESLMAASQLPDTVESIPEGLNRMLQAFLGGRGMRASEAYNTAQHEREQAALAGALGGANLTPEQQAFFAANPEMAEQYLMEMWTRPPVTGGGPTEAERAAAEWQQMIAGDLGSYTPARMEGRTVSMEPTEIGAGEIAPGEFEVATTPAQVPAQGSGYYGALIQAGYTPERAAQLLRASIGTGQVAEQARDIITGIMFALPGRDEDNVNLARTTLLGDGTDGLPNDGQLYEVLYDPRSGKIESVLGLADPGGQWGVTVGPDGTVQMTQGRGNQAANLNQGQAANFAGLMEQANNLLTDPAHPLDVLGTNWAEGRVLTAVGNIFGVNVTSQDYQAYEQAKRQFINALLRRESGATIRDEEFVNYEQTFFPQPGNGPEVIEQKRQARLAAIRLLQQQAGPLAPTGGQTNPLGFTR